MLKTILTKLNGHGTEADSLDAALQQLGRDREAVRAELDTLNQKRRQALLDDANDETLDQLERAIDRAAIRLEKVNIAEQPLRAKRDAALAEAARQARARDRKAFAAEFEPLCEEALTLSARAAALVGKAAGMQLDPTVRQGALPLLGFLANWIAERQPDINAARAALARDGAVKKPGARKPAAPPPSRPAQSKPPETLQRQVRLYADYGGPPPGPLTAPRTPDDSAPLQAGEARVKVLSAGFSPSDDRPQAAYGQVLRMPAGAAHKAADRGAVEILEGGAPR
jgi:hypothetical protein